MYCMARNIDMEINLAVDKIILNYRGAPTRYLMKPYSANIKSTNVNLQYTFAKHNYRKNFWLYSMYFPKTNDQCLVMFCVVINLWLVLEWYVFIISFLSSLASVYDTSLR